MDITTRTFEIPAAASTRATKLALHTCGKGPLAVLIHGFPLDHRMWHGVMRGQLASDRTLCAIDLRGHGASPPCGDEAHTMELLADDVATVIHALADGPVDICGLSMGGYVAFALHNKHPELVRSLVLSNTRAADDTDAQRQAREAAIETVQAKGQAPIADGMLPKLVANNAADEHRDQLRQMIESQPVATIVADQRGLQQRPDRRDELATIAAPTLVVVGDQDAITPPAEAERMAAAIPHAQLAVIPNTGHMTPMEDPTAWSQSVAKLW